MKISRYIKFPLIFIVLYAIYFSVFVGGFSLTTGLVGIIFGAVFGFGIQFYSDYKVKQLKPDATEKDFDVRQNQTFILFYDYDKAFDLCLESIDYIEKGRIKNADKFTGTIKAKTGITWRTFGVNIDFKVSKLADYSTQIEVSTSPFVPTTLVTYGEELKTINRISDFFRQKNDEKNLRNLEEKTEIPIDAQFNRENEYVKTKV
jgi:hypothetical protein